MQHLLDYRQYLLNEFCLLATVLSASDTSVGKTRFPAVVELTFFFFFFFVVMGFELRVYTLSHSTSPFL
jgi:hypothetical protein